MSLLNDLFINLCILGMLLFTLNGLGMKRKGFISPSAKLYRKIQYGIGIGLVGVIVMHYTIPYNGTILDLRHIVLTVAALYGGMVPVIIAALLIALGRILLFDINTVTLLATTNIVIIGLFCGAISKLNVDNWKKSLYMTLGNLTFTSIVFFLVIKDKSVLVDVYVGYWSITLLGGAFIHYLGEYLRKSKELFQTTQEYATRDFLTGLYNVRTFEQVLLESFERADLNNEILSFMYIDIDHFKQVNDTYGHLAGDEILKQLSQILRDSCRSIDIVSRNGGEEFSIILPSCSAIEAIEIAERIRKAVENHPFRLMNGTILNMTISIGISAYGETIRNNENLIKQADECLFKAKSSGRNKVVLANLLK
jgi:diguanylate cyclase